MHLFLRPLLFCPFFCLLPEGLEATGNLATGVLDAASPQIKVEGRYQRTPQGSLKLGYPGVGLHLRHEGRKLTLQLRSSSDDNAFDLLIDQGEALRLKVRKGEQTLDLLNEEKEALRSLVLVRRNESWQGTCELLSLDPGPGGRLLEAPALPSRRLLFIGDSVTCGSSVDVRPGEEPLGNQRSNGRLSYGYLLARKLGAQVHLVSYGGRGIIRDWQGIRETNNAPQFYELGLPDEATSFWKHSDYLPDIVSISLGTNDFNQGIPDQNEFVNAYVELVRKVRRDAPLATIFLLGSSIVWDEPGKAPRGSVLEAYLDEVARKTKDPRVKVLRLKHYPGLPHDAHPTAPEHEAMAAALEPAFREALATRD